MIETQADFLRYVIAILERLDVAHLVCGSIASSSLGEPRLTLDVDIVISLPLDKVEPLCREFPEADFYVSLEAAKSAVRLRRQFNVIHPTTGNKVDFMICGRDEWSQSQMTRRRREVLMSGVETFVGSPEDTIISKMRYYREGGSDKHLRDCAGVLAVQREKIDRTYIDHWAKHFQVMDVWEAIQCRVREVHGF